VLVLHDAARESSSLALSFSSSFLPFFLLLDELFVRVSANIDQSRCVQGRRNMLWLIDEATATPKANLILSYNNKA
jgi:hypothetical protein